MSAAGCVSQSKELQPQSQSRVMRARLKCWPKASENGISARSDKSSTHLFTASMFGIVVNRMSPAGRQPNIATSNTP
jgi:hypothetical protein